MEAGSRGVFLDAFAAGRQALNEMWNFHELDLFTEINLCGSPIFLNRLKIIPSIDRPDGLGVMGEHAYAASLTVVDDHAQDWPTILENLRQQLQEIPEILGGASLLPRAGISIRILTRSAIALSTAIRQLLAASRQQVFHLSPLELRKY